ncbi:MAG: lipid-A-disaccharide synthase N-terminal domain-containing protein [Rikenellaceae bacterium]|nr:lipid-A-disaccharide synthase N-terminal domain-containing protein [Rikenellaceae bacterium]
MIYVIGLLAQLFFGARTIFQWILSERAKKVLSPAIYWILSILGSYLFFIYGWLREDFAIILGQIISYYIYIWNLKIKGVWQKTHIIIRILLVITPIVAITLAAENADQFIATFLRNDNVPLWLIIFGSTGQVLFTFRFIYQIIYSAKRKESILPLGFWVISLTGSTLIIAYAIIRMDPILILGQSAGFIAYIRNIAIYHKHERLT